MYKIPHGLANTVILPYVLEYYGKSVYKPLARLYDLIRISDGGSTEKEKSLKFIEHIKSLELKMNIPNKLNEIKEANPLYPVP